MELSIDTSGFLFNPKQSDFIERMSVYEEFRLPDRLLNEKTKKEFEIDHEQVLAYIAIMYDIKSSLLKDVPLLPQRKHQAALLVGWTRSKKDEFDENVEAIILGDVYAVNSAIVKYVLLQHSIEFAMFVAYSNVFAMEMFKMLSNKQTKDTLNNYEKAGKKIEEINQKLFGGDEVRSMRDQLYAAAEEERVRLRPEDIAEVLSRDEDPLEGYNPYGGNYEPEPHKFVGDE